MSQSESRIVSLFPLELVLLPGELLPLHIFEERYRRMIAQVRDSGEEFGIVFRLGEGVAAVGCTAELVDVLEEFPDGRLNIVVRGANPFRLEELVIPEDAESEPLGGVVELLEDRSTDVPLLVLREAEQLVERMRELSDEPPPLPSEDEVPASFRLALSVDIEVTMKQRLLQLRDEAARLELLNDHLRTLVGRLELLQARKDAIRGNGKAY